MRTGGPMPAQKGPNPPPPPPPKDPNPMPPPKDPNPMPPPKDPTTIDPGTNPIPKDPTPSVGPSGAARDDTYLTIKPSLKAMLDKMELLARMTRPTLLVPLPTWMRTPSI